MRGGVLLAVLLVVPPMAAAAIPSPLSFDVWCGAESSLVPSTSPTPIDCSGDLVPDAIVSVTAGSIELVRGLRTDTLAFPLAMCSAGFCGGMLVPLSGTGGVTLGVEAAGLTVRADSPQGLRGLILVDGDAPDLAAAGLGGVVLSTPSRPALVLQAAIARVGNVTSIEVAHSTPATSAAVRVSLGAGGWADLVLASPDGAFTLSGTARAGHANVTVTGAPGAVVSGSLAHAAAEADVSATLTPATRFAFGSDATATFLEAHSVTTGNVSFASLSAPGLALTVRDLRNATATWTHATSHVRLTGATVGLYAAPTSIATASLTSPGAAVGELHNLDGGLAGRVLPCLVTFRSCTTIPMLSGCRTLAPPDTLHSWAFCRFPG